MTSQPWTQSKRLTIHRFKKQISIYDLGDLHEKLKQASCWQNCREARRNNETISFLLVISRQNKSWNLGVWKSFQDVQRAFKRQLSDSQIGCKPTKSLSNTWTITSQKHLIKHLISQARHYFTIVFDFFVWFCLIPSRTTIAAFPDLRWPLRSLGQCVNLPRR